MMQASLERVPQLAGVIKAMSPQKRMAVPEEVVEYIMFLCGAGASYINGTGQIIDGGATLTMNT